MKLHRTFKGFLFVLIPLTAVWVIIATQKQRIKTSTERTLSDMLDAGITFNRASTNFTSALTVEGVRIIIQPDTSSQIILLIPRMYFAYHLPDLFRDGPGLRRIEADSVFVRMVSADTSSWTAEKFQNLSKKQSGDNSLPFPFRQLTIGYCQIEVEDSLKANLQEIALTLKQDETARLLPHFELKTGWVKKKDQSARITGCNLNGILYKNNNSISAQGTLAWKSVSLGKIELGQGEGNVWWNRHIFELTDFVSDFYEGKIRAKGTYCEDASYPNAFDGALENVRFDRLWASIGDSIATSYGILNSRIHATGTGLADTAWTIEGDHVLSSLRYRKRNISDIRAHMRVKHGRASFQLEHPDMHVDALWVLGRKALDGHFSVDMRSLDPLRFFVDLKKIQGNLNCRGDLSGTRENPELSVVITGGGCRYENLAIDTLAGLLSMRNRTVRIERLSGIQIPDSNLALNLGKISAHGKVDIDHQNGNLNIRFVGPSIRGLIADSALAVAEFTNKSFTLHPFRVFQNNHILFESRLTAGAPLTRLGKRMPVSAEMILSRFKIGWLSPFLPAAWQIGGTVSGEMEIHGIAEKPIPKGFLQIEDFNLNRGTRIGTLEGWQGRLSVENRSMKIDSLFGMVDSIPFRLSGDFETIKREKVSGKLAIEAPNQSRVLFIGQVSRQNCAVETHITKADLSLFKKYFGTLSALSGYADGELAILGATQDPEVEGFVRLNKVILQPAIMPSPLQNGSGFCRLEKHRVYVDSIRFDSENGRFSADASARIENRRLLLDALHIKTDQLSFHKKDSYDIRIRSSRLALTPDGEEFLLSGQIDLGKTTIWQPFQIRDLLSRSKRPVRPSQAKETTADHIQCRIRLQTNEKFWIDNNLAKLRLSPEIEMTGTLSKPNLKGRITVKEGYALYLDRKFEIKTGTLDFIDPYQINPVVELSAATSVRNYETSDNTEYAITLSASGVLSDAQIQLSSSPEMSQPEIITLLTFGTTRKQLAGQGGISRDNEWIQILRQRAEALSSQRINAYATQRIGTLFKLDHLSIDGNLFQNGKSGAPQITASRALTPKINVKYMNRVGQLNEQFIVVDYQFSRRMLIEGQTNQYGQSGMDLKYRIGFK